MAVQYGQWVAMEIGTMREMGTELKTYRVPSCILFACLTLCNYAYVCFNSRALDGRKVERAAYVMPNWAGRMASI